VCVVSMATAKAGTPEPTEAEQVFASVQTKAGSRVAGKAVACGKGKPPKNRVVPTRRTAAGGMKGAAGGDRCAQPAVVLRGVTAWW